MRNQPAFQRLCGRQRTLMRLIARVENGQQIESVDER
jgi:hypothetical protein